MGFFARRLFVFGVVFAALAMLMAPAIAGADDDDDDDGGGGDRAFCAPAGPPVPEQCHLFFGFTRFDFDASSGPLGENPSGAFRYDEGGLGFFFEGQVTCLQVTGNRASIGGTVTASNFLPGGSGFAFTAVDNTPVAPDQMSTGTELPAGPPANTPACGDVTGAGHTVTFGDIVVQDNVAGGGGDDEEDEEDEEDDEDEDDDDEGDDDDDEGDDD
jgi:hypothetical protein